MDADGEQIAPRFYEFLEEPLSAALPDGYRKIDHVPPASIEYRQIKNLSVTRIQSFVDRNRSDTFHLESSPVSTEEFDTQQSRSLVCKFGNYRTTIRPVSYYCQAGLPPGGHLDLSMKDFYARMSNLALRSAEFRILNDLIDDQTRRPDTPTKHYLSFFTFRHSFEAAPAPGPWTPATKAVAVVGLPDYRTNHEMVRIDFELTSKPAICLRPSVFSAEGYFPFCAFDGADGFGLTRMLDTGEDGVMEFVVPLDAAYKVARIEALGPVEAESASHPRQVNADAIVSSLLSRAGLI